MAFPFGYGLSYTSFAYSNLQAASNGVTLTVTNTGKRAGAEIVQLYVAEPGAEVFRPAQELKGFAKVQLQPGESKTVTIPLDDKAFRYWNTRTDSWEVEGGSYELRVGASSADIRLTAVVEVAGTGAPNPYAASICRTIPAARCRACRMTNGPPCWAARCSREKLKLTAT